MVVCCVAQESGTPHCEYVNTEEEQFSLTAYTKPDNFCWEIPSTVSTPYSKFQLNHAKCFHDINFQILALVSILILIFEVNFFLFSLRCESYHKVETGYLIALKFGTQTGGVRIHIGTKLGKCYL